MASLAIPPLENGDRLTRSEFERRYRAMPHLKKAELIEGVVYIMGSPLRLRSHGEPHANIMTWLGYYKTFTPGVSLGIEPTVRLDADNEPQPDAVLFVPGRQAVISADDYIQGAPELIVEIAASSAAIDLHDKKRAYRRNGVQDYLVWRTLEQQLDWFWLLADDYQLQVPDERGVVRSQAFPGLWLDVGALLAGRMDQVLAVLQQGLDSAAHQTFVQQLGSSP
ncbi:MAG: Uma2 family endonuclease [Thermostichales cyanobacterium BF3_bins_165]